MFRWITCVVTKEFPARRWILYIFCFITVSTASGVVYGWPALRRQLLQEEDSTLDESTMGAIFTVGAWSTQGGRFFVGLARDRFGTRYVTSFCILLVAMGFLGLAWSNPNNAVALGISMFFVGLGSGAQLCVQPVAGLFPNTSGTIISSLSGAFQISGLVFLALTTTSTGGDEGTRTIRFSTFALILIAISVLAMILLPKGKSFLLQEQGSCHTNILNGESTKETITPQKTSSETTVVDVESTMVHHHVLDSESEGMVASDIKQVELHADDRLLLDNGTPRSTSGTDIQETPAIVLDDSSSDISMVSSSPTALQQMKSIEYIFLCVWFSICLIPLQYYIGSIGFQLEEKGDTDGFYTDMFSIIYASSTVLSFAGGFLSDKCGLGITQGLATMMCAGSFFFLVSEVSLEIQIVGMALYGVGRLLIFGMYFANCGKRFGYTNFGTLAGLGLLVSALASLFQYPMISAAAKGHSRAVNIGSGTVLLSLFPYFAWLYHRERISPEKSPSN